MDAVSFPIYQVETRTILSPTTGFIAEAGFSHSLTPARNCTFGCSYCYVPTMGVYGGLKPDDWRRWGAFTTYKSNAAALLRKTLAADQTIYCSPVVDPYQPTEAEANAMQPILDEMLAKPPAVIAIQTRGSLILRDLDRLRELGSRTTLRVSFSVPSNRPEVLRWFEPRCASFEERLEVMAALRDAGIEVFATIAPVLPCDPEELVATLVSRTGADIIADPLHVRSTREARRNHSRRRMEDRREAGSARVARARLSARGLHSHGK